MAKKLTQEEKIALQTFCEYQKSVKDAEKKYAALKKPVNDEKIKLRTTLLQVLGEHSCMVLGGDYIVRKTSRSTRQFSEEVIVFSMSDVTGEATHEYATKNNCTSREALVKVIVAQVKKNRTTEKDYADVVKKPLKGVDVVPAPPDALLSVQRYKEVCSSLKRIGGEKKEKVGPLEEKVSTSRPGVLQYMKKGKLWSQRVNINIEGSQGMLCSYYIRRKVVTRKPAFKVSEIEELIRGSVNHFLPETFAFDEFRQRHDAILKKCVETFQSIPATSNETVTFDQGGIKRKL